MRQGLAKPYTRINQNTLASNTRPNSTPYTRLKRVIDVEQDVFIARVILHRLR